MSVLANFPMLSQRDGDKNADFDCVAASIAAALEWLTGKRYTAAQVKDAVYGVDYVGGTAAFKYIDYCTEQGVKLFAMNGSDGQLVADLHATLAAGHPALITEPDPYASGWTHVCVAYKDDANSITVMDPWIDAPVTKSNTAWSATLLDNQIWILERSMIIPDKWHDDGTTLTAPNGHTCRAGFRGKVLAGWEPSDLPLEEEHGAAGGGTEQMFSRTTLHWTSASGVTVVAPDVIVQAHAFSQIASIVKQAGGI